MTHNSLTCEDQESVKVRVLEDVDIRQPQLYHCFDWSFGRTQLVDSWHVHLAFLKPPFCKTCDSLMDSCMCSRRNPSDCSRPALLDSRVTTAHSQPISRNLYLQHKYGRTVKPALSWMPNLHTFLRLLDNGLLEERVDMHP